MSTAALLLAATLATGNPTEHAPLTLRLNGEDRGVHFIRLAAEQPCLTPAQLREFGVPDAAFPRATSPHPAPLPEGEGTQEQCLGAAQLAPTVALKLNSAEAILDVAVDPALLATQTVIAAEPREEISTQYPRSAYLNYGLDITRGGDERGVDVLAPLELAGRWDRWLADTTLIAGEGGVQRLFSGVQRDFPERLAALRFGDVAAGGSATAGAALLGVQFAREYGYEPLKRRTPGLDFAGVLDTPSTVEVYVDGRQVSRAELPAGPFTLQELPVPSGAAGTVRVEIVDAFGNRRSVEEPFFLGSSLLAAGESEFSYSLGLPRMSGTNDRYAHQSALMLAHRWGLRDWLTLGYEGLATDGLAALGAESAFGLGRAGEIGLTYVAGGAPAQPGHQASVVYRYSNGPLNFSADFIERSADFRTLTPSFGGGQRRWRMRLGTRLPLGYSASIGYAHARSEPSDSDPHKVETLYSAGINGRLGRLGTVNVQAQWDAQRSGLAGLVLFSTAGRSGALTQLSLADDDTQRELAARHMSPLRNYTGGAYRLDYRHTAADASAAQIWGGEYEWRATQFTARALHQQTEDAGQSRVVLAGSVAWSAEGYALGQPVRGSFVAVDLADVNGAEVYADGRLIGRSGAQPVMVADLTPYLPHSLNLQLPPEMPIGVDLKVTQQRLALAARSGQWLRFVAHRLQLYEGRVVRGDGTPVQFTPVTVRRAGATSAETVTGEGGYLYLEQLEPGIYDFEAGGSRPCRFQARLPEGSDLVTPLGFQICEAI